FSNTHVWDQSAVTAIAKTVLKYQRLGKKVTIVGLNEESEALVNKVGLSAPSGH
ncbi:MAG: STAS domain-containing protein, partial [Campylobacterales bacterium]|nr:STAS domain-containing protein [Campylobacterales bacterium]